METNLILSKESSESEIKRYFNAVLELSKSNNEFPINLDEVWMLVYGRKSDAAEALQRDFIENVDYKVLRQNPQNSNGGRPSTEYRLSVSCMEFFIARKVRPVFEVYRQVFHKTTAQALPSGNRPTDSLTEQVKASLAWVEGVAGFLNLDNPTKLEMLKQVAGPLGMPVPVCVPMHAPADKIDLTTNRRDRDPYYDLYISGKIKSATKLLREHGSKMKARTFNKLLVEKGYLEVVTVPSDTRGQRTYNKITEAGLEFGVNLSIGSQKDVWPLWFPDRFGRLLDLVKRS